MCVNEGLNAKGNTVGAEARFTVETFSAGRGDLDVTVVNPDGQQEKVGHRIRLCVIRQRPLLFIIPFQSHAFSYCDRMRRRKRPAPY